MGCIPSSLDILISSSSMSTLLPFIKLLPLQLQNLLAWSIASYRPKQQSTPDQYIQMYDLDDVFIAHRAHIINQKMGCTSTVGIQSRRLVPLPPEVVNSYIDKFPAIVLSKVKEKFELFAEKDSKQLTQLGFLKLYSPAKLPSELLVRLYVYFADNQKGNIKFRQFILKYSTLLKCESKVLFQILFEMYRSNHELDTMSQEQYQNFEKSETAYIKNIPGILSPPITMKVFTEMLAEAQFNVQEYQSRLFITSQEDIPFKAISRELQDCDFNDFTPDSEYYLLSNAWFYRWSFYYQQFDITFDRNQMKSTKLLKEDKSSVGRRYKKRQSANLQRKKTDSLRTSQIGNILVEQPKSIDFQDIQGEYRGELKQSLKISSQIKIISLNLWKLLCSLHPAEQEFRRIAINEDTLEYYPKTIFYFKANSKGQMLQNQQQVKHLPLSYKPYLFLQGRSQKAGVFTKNFGQKNWRQIQGRKTLSQVSLDPRFLVVVADDRQKFIHKNLRKEIKKENIQPGDRVFTHFTYLKSHSQALIIGLGNEDTFKVHFKGYSFRYEVMVKRQDISVLEEEAALSSAKKKNQSIFKGINNIGNTCFMNSIVQCLSATPILQVYLQKYEFKEKTHPLGHALAEMARCLANNEKPSPIQFKKVIDTYMPLFSGYQQHDAQQFLNLLLDKLNQQLKEQPTVIDYLFGGKIQSKLTCSSCKKVKHIQQKMYILSLPIPEADFNYFSVILVPVSSRNMKKIYFRLPRNATVADYCNAFEQRSGQNKRDYVFVQTSYNTLKKVKSQILSASSQMKKVIDVGIVPNVALLAFEKIPSKFYLDLLGKKSSLDAFKDYRPKGQTFWTICKIPESKDEKGQLTIEYLSNENQIEKVKISKDNLQENTSRLGNSGQISFSFKKIHLRKHNSTLKRLQGFGMQFIVGFPKWSSYQDLVKIVEKYIDNTKEKDARKITQDSSGDYIIRFLEPNRYKCIFCNKQIGIFNVEEKDFIPCCDVLQKQIPYAWEARTKAFWVYVDWLQLSKCRASFCSYLEVDQISRNVEQSRQQQFIQLQSCIKLHSQTESVEMQCDSCKGKYQNLQHLIANMPNILVVHMKQFRFTPEGHLIKLDLRLKWQQFLDTSKYVLNCNGRMYELFALVKHNGNTQSGHYTCMAKRKHPFENKKVWVNFDDDLTEITRQEQKFIDDAYLLFYKKVDMPTSSFMYTDLNNNL